MASEQATKPSVLIIGGLGTACSEHHPSMTRGLTCALGYTGRHLTKYIHDNSLASQIRIVDKHLPELAWLAPEYKEACSRERFIQADAAQESGCP